MCLNIFRLIAAEQGYRSCSKVTM